MHQSGIAPASTGPTCIRLLIAFILGLPIGLLYFFVSSSPSRAWWRSSVPVAVLAGAMLLSILLDPAVRQRVITPIRTLLSLLLVLAGLFVGGYVILPSVKQSLSLLVALLIPLAVGLAAV